MAKLPEVAPPARFSVGQAVRTPAGASGRVICVDAKGAWPVVALLEDGDGEAPRQFSMHGWCRECAQYGPDRNQAHDLLPSPRRAVVWVWLLENGGTFVTPDSRKGAGVIGAVGCIRVEIEEGRFDE